MATIATYERSTSQEKPLLTAPLPIAEFLSLFRSDLARTERPKRKEQFESTLRRVGLEVKERKGLFSLACERGVSPPPIQWRQLANSIMALDDDSLPFVVAYGVPELFPAPAGEMETILDNAAIGNYRVEPVLFGSVCWLYHHRGKWRLATKRVSNAKHLSIRPGGITFLAAFEEAVAECSSFDTREAFSDSSAGDAHAGDAHAGESEARPTANGREEVMAAFLRRLDKQCTYGFVLHHQRLHTFAYSGFDTRVWHVSTIHNVAGEAVTRVIGIPHPPRLFQARLDFGGAPLFPSSPIPPRSAVIEPHGDRINASGEDDSDPEVDYRLTTMTDPLRASPIFPRLRERVAALCRGCTHSLSLTPENARRSQQALHNAGEPTEEDLAFGLVLRTVNPSATFPNGHVVIKSPLYHFIERHIGKLVPIRLIVSRLVYAPSEEQERFCRIFPHLSGLYRQALTDFRYLAECIVRRQTAPKLAKRMKCDTVDRLLAIVRQCTTNARPPAVIGSPLTIAEVERTMLALRGDDWMVVLDALVALLPTEEPSPDSALTDFPPLGSAR